MADFPLPFDPQTTDLEKMTINAEWRTFYNQCEKDVIKAMVKATIKDQLSKGIYQGKIAQKIYDQMPKKEFTVYKMVTISGKDDLDPKAFWERCEEYVENTTWITEAVYSIEQRSEGDQQPYGWHLHIVGKFAQPKSKIIEKTYRSFKRFIVAPNYVDVRPSSIERYDYVKGLKSDAKMPKVEKDRKLRKELGIPNFAEKKSNVSV